MKTTTKLRSTMRRLRGAYIENVRAGRCKMDRNVLARFDQLLKRVEDGAKSISAEH